MGAIIDDENLEGDNVRKSIFSVEHYREALREEMGSHGYEIKVQPPQAKTKFGDKSVVELLKLVRTPDSELNWCLFTVNEKGDMAVTRERASLFVSPRTTPQ